MCDPMVPRGPDASGEWVEPGAGVALGHRRLAIIDLTDTGAQPMVSCSGRHVITYNGEIYNFPEIRRELEGHGARFRSTSDTEVMLESFERWGIRGALEHFVGMFAFALWDREERTLTLARDRIGEKPLYYGWVGSALVFGSTLESLAAHPDWRGEIDRDALALYFQLQYVPCPWSIYRGIRKLPPATFLSLRLRDLRPGQLPDPTPYWSLRQVAEDGCADPFQGTDSEAIDHLEILLKQSVAGQMLSDVPLGALLSGGVDSSAVVALMQAQSRRPVRTFTIGFDSGAYDESRFAARIAQHLCTDHTEIRVTPADAMTVIPKMPELYDEPFADQSQIPTCLVAQLARRHVTVCLSGDGGDELFCGYNRHLQLLRLWSVVGPLPRPLRRGIGALLTAVPSGFYQLALEDRKHGVLADQVQKLTSILSLGGPEEMYQRLAVLWDQPERIVRDATAQPMLVTDRRGWPDLPGVMDRLMYVEAMTSLPDNMMVKLDRAAMGASLETRVPMLDHRIVEFSWRLPFRFKVRDGVGKWILRQVLYRRVPREMIERPKSGFDAPIDEWLRGPLRDWAEDLLSPGRLSRDGYLNPDPIVKRWQAHVSGRQKWQYHLWAVLMFQAWMDRHRGRTSG
jgi:asparagine synthase (glutamine-hydrolysing)